MKQMVWLSVLLVALPQSVFGWDATGHMIVCQVAYRKLGADSPIVKQIAGRAAKISLDVYDLRSKSWHTRHYDQFSIGTWYDDVRPLLKNNDVRTIHYFNIPLAADSFPGDPVLDLFRRKVAELRNGASQPQQGAGGHVVVEDPVAIVLHLTGDFHQPLHCADLDDRGGTKTSISGQRIGADSLHSFWDRVYRFDWNGTAAVPAGRGLSQEADNAEALRAWVEALEKQFPNVDQNPGGLDSEAAPDVKWIMGSHRLARNVAYKGVTGVPAANPVRQSLKVDGPYLHNAHVVACKRLLLAGHRLARALAQGM